MANKSDKVKHSGMLTGNGGASTSAGFAFPAFDQLQKPPRKLSRDNNSGSKAITADSQDTPFGRFCARTGYMPGQVIDIEIDRIDQSPVQRRFIYLQERVADIGRSVNKQSQRDPVHLIVNPEDETRFYCLDGYTRIKGMVEFSGSSIVQAKVYDLSNDRLAWYRFSDATFSDRTQATDIDTGLSWANLLKQKVVKNQAQLATELGVTPGHVARMLCYAELPDSLIQFLAEHAEKFTSRFAEQIAHVYKSCDLERAMKLAQRHAAKPMTFNQLESERRRLVGEAGKQPTREHYNKHPVIVDEVIYGAINESQKTGNIRAELTGLNPAQVKAVIEAIQEAILINR